jgi:hypothetical protein
MFDPNSTAEDKMTGALELCVGCVGAVCCVIVGIVIAIARLL